MDFLDPKAKRRHLLQLIIGYGLMGILIILTTAILVYQAYGFDVDRNTGQVIQNGLVFVDSAPDGATVYFNNQEQKDKSNNRYAMPSGEYNLAIHKDGYRNWNRDFNLNGGSVERFTYPMLIPENLARQEAHAFDAAPTFITASPDRRWTLTNRADSLTNFIEYDLNNLKDNKPVARDFVIPGNLMNTSVGPHTLELVEWSSDNKHMLVKHSFADANEFVVISRDQPSSSININTLLGQSPTSITLRDKKFDQWYLYNQTDGTLATADAKKTITQLLTNVTSFKTHDDDTILYSQAVEDGKYQRVFLRQDDQTYQVKDVAPGAMFLDIARFNSAWYVVVGADAEQKAYIYRNPQEVMSKRDATKPTPVTILKTTGPITSLSFSQNTRFIMAQSGQHFEVYDNEYDRLYSYNIASPFDVGSKVTWMDGHRLTSRSGGKIITFDFNGANIQELIVTQASAPAIFDRDYLVLYTFDPSSASPGKSALYATQLRLDGDR
jgi:hypothetical protein